jgi:hypothetical protein
MVHRRSSPPRLSPGHSRTPGHPRTRPTRPRWSSGSRATARRPSSAPLTSSANAKGQTRPSCPRRCWRRYPRAARRGLRAAAPGLPAPQRGTRLDAGRAPGPRDRGERSRPRLPAVHRGQSVGREPGQRGHPGPRSRRSCPTWSRSPGPNHRVRPPAAVHTDPRAYSSCSRCTAWWARRPPRRPTAEPGGGEYRASGPAGLQQPYRAGETPMPPGRWLTGRSLGVPGPPP